MLKQWMLFLYLLYLLDWDVSILGFSTPLIDYLLPKIASYWIYILNFG